LAGATFNYFITQCIPFIDRSIAERALKSTSTWPRLRYDVGLEEGEY